MTQPPRLQIGVMARIDGVVLYARDPNTNRAVAIGILDPEVARGLARDCTLKSFEVEDLRREIEPEGLE